MQLTDEIGTYHPFADWETAEPGDIIGGFTTFYGDQQGQGKAAAREHNISEGVKRIDGVGNILLQRAVCAIPPFKWL